MNFSKRISNLVLLGRCLAHAFFYGRADKVPKSISRIIVIPAGKLGDVVSTTPVLAAVRRHFPNARIIVAGENYKLLEPLLANSGLVDEYYSNEVKADVALLTGLSFEMAAPLYLSGISLVVTPEVLGGFSPQNTRPYMILKKFLKTYPYHIGEYAPRERLRCLESLGIIEDDTTKCLGFSKVALESIEKYFEAGEFTVGITPTAGHKIKEWPEERFAQVADYLILRYKAKVIIVGGPKDDEKIKKTLGFMKEKTRTLSTTDLNLDELKALTSKLNLFISVDTGPIYIAEAFDVPTIDITGPIDEKEQPPQGLLHRNVTPPYRSRPELFVLNARFYNKKEALRQVNSITVDLVKKEIDALMRDLKQ